MRSAVVTASFAAVAVAAGNVRHVKRQDISLPYEQETLTSDGTVVTRDPLGTFSNPITVPTDVTQTLSIPEDITSGLGTDTTTDGTATETSPSTAPTTVPTTGITSGTGSPNSTATTSGGSDESGSSGGVITMTSTQTEGPTGTETESGSESDPAETSDPGNPAARPTAFVQNAAAGVLAAVGLAFAL